MTLDEALAENARLRDAARTAFLAAPETPFGCRIGGEGSLTGLFHRSLPVRPCTRQFDRSTRPVVVKLGLLEKVQHMLCTISGPDGKQVMVGVLESAAAAYGDEPWVSFLR